MIGRSGDGRRREHGLGLLLEGRPRESPPRSLESAGMGTASDGNGLDPDGFRELTEEAIDLVSRHPTVGPKVRALGIVCRVVFTDLKLLLDVGPADAKALKKGHHLVWAWGGAWRGPKAAVLVTMPSDVAHRCAIGRENAASLAAKDVIRINPLDETVDRDRALDLVPILVPLQKKWVERLRERGRADLLR